jgi:hypothetical protein
MSGRSLAWHTSNVNGREDGLTVFNANNSYLRPYYMWHRDYDHRKAFLRIPRLARLSGFRQINLNSVAVDQNN